MHTGGHVNISREIKEVLQVVRTNSKWQCNASTNSNSQSSSIKNNAKLSTFSSNISTNMPLYEPPGVLTITSTSSFFFLIEDFYWCGRDSIPGRGCILLTILPLFNDDTYTSETTTTSTTPSISLANLHFNIIVWTSRFRSINTLTIALEFSKQFFQTRKEARD